MYKYIFYIKKLKYEYVTIKFVTLQLHVRCDIGEL